MTKEYQQAKSLLYELIGLCTSRLNGHPHAPGLAHHRDRLAARVITLDPGDQAAIAAINQQLPRLRDILATPGGR